MAGATQYAAYKEAREEHLSRYSSLTCGGLDGAENIRAALEGLLEALRIEFRRHGLWNGGMLDMFWRGGAEEEEVQVRVAVLRRATREPRAWRERALPVR
jgi:hypothetical protein